MNSIVSAVMNKMIGYFENDVKRVNIFEADLSKQQVKSIKEKYFRTSVGTAYLDNMYLTKAEN